MGEVEASFGGIEPEIGLIANDCFMVLGFVGVVGRHCGDLRCAMRLESSLGLGAKFESVLRMRIDLRNVQLAILLLLKHTQCLICCRTIARGL